MRFDSQEIFGSVALRCDGPVPEYRAMRSYAPGQDGYRVYKLGRKHGGLWVASGRLVDATRGGLEEKVYQFGLYVDGGLYEFESVGGNDYENCELTEYRPVDQVRASLSLGGYTVRVQGVIVRVSV